MKNTSSPKKPSKAKPLRVTITVTDGVAEVTKCPRNVVVKIVDND